MSRSIIIIAAEVLAFFLATITADHFPLLCIIPCMQTLSSFHSSTETSVLMVLI